MKLKSIKDVDVKDKRVFLRVDFNVSVEGGKIEDDFRIRKSLHTIDYLLEHEAKIIIGAHLGRPKGVDKNLSTKVLSKKLSELLDYEVGFISDCIGDRVKNAVDDLRSGEILMLENLRFYKEEQENDDNFARELASFADVYVDDAFSVSHRAHASISAITKFIPSYAGFLLQDEVEALSSVYGSPKHPLVMVMGGAKAPTKVKLIKRFMDKTDHILLGGVIANVVLDAKGIAVGKSKIDETVKDSLKEIDLTSPKLHLPVDVVVANDVSEDADIDIVATGSVDDSHIILDIGPSTIDLFSDIVSKAKMIVWNGPLGYYELKKFSTGTDEFADALCSSSAYKIVGGGESIAALDKIGDLYKIDFVSTGGGAMLEFLAGSNMPGIEPLIKK